MLLPCQVLKVTLQVTFQFDGINLNNVNIRTSHRRANKNRKNAKMSYLARPAIFSSGHVILNRM